MVNFCAHNSLPLVPVHSQRKPVKALPPYSFQIHFNIILPSMTSSSMWSCPVMSPHQNPTSISSLPHICHISCLFMPTHLVSVNCTTTQTHTPLCLFCLSTGIISVSSVNIQIFHCTDTHIRHAAVFPLWHRKVNLEDSGPSWHCKQSKKSFCTAGYLKMNLLKCHKPFTHKHSVTSQNTHLNLQQNCCENLKPQD